MKHSGSPNSSYFILPTYRKRDKDDKIHDHHKR